VTTGFTLRVEPDFCWKLYLSSEECLLVARYVRVMQMPSSISSLPGWHKGVFMDPSGSQYYVCHHFEYDVYGKLVCSTCTVTEHSCYGLLVCLLLTVVCEYPWLWTACMLVPYKYTSNCKTGCEYPLTTNHL